MKNFDGDIVDIINLAGYSQDLELDKSKLYKVIKGLRSSHKGWTAV